MTDDRERLAVEDITDYGLCCALCGVNDRVENSRYCESCREVVR